MTVSDPSALAAVIDQLGVVAELDANEQAVECVVLLKLVHFDGERGTSLGMYASAGLDWIAKSGLIDAARQVMYSGTTERREDNE